MAGMDMFEEVLVEECKQWFRRKCLFILTLLSNPLHVCQADGRKRLVSPPILFLAVALFLCPSFLTLHL